MAPRKNNGAKPVPDPDKKAQDFLATLFPTTTTVPAAPKTKTTVTPPKTTTTTTTVPKPPKTTTVKAPADPDAKAKAFLDSIAGGIDKPVQGPVADPRVLAKQNIGLDFQGPLAPEVQAALRKLRAQERVASRLGVPSEDIQAIAEGKGDPNRGFIGPAKAVGRFFKRAGGAIVPDVLDISDIPLPFTDRNLGEVVAPVAAKAGKTALVAASPALEKLDFGRRVITSTLKEIGDEIRVLRSDTERGDVSKAYGKAGFSAKDWWNQLSAENGVSGGDLFAGIDNPYLNQFLGFSADIAFDPVTYVAGPAGIGKTAVTRGVVTGGTKVGGAVAERAAAATAKQVAAAAAKRLAEQALDDAIRIGDNVGASLAEDAIAVANKKAAEAAKELAKDASTRNIGRTANQAMAEQALSVRDEAQKIIDLGTGTADEIAYAREAVDALSDKVIRDIQSSGLAGISGSFVDILKGKRTAAQNVLGVRGGLRIGNPLAVFSAQAPRRVIIPGTERITNVAGKLLAESRLGIGRTALGVKVINNITPTGEGGLLGSADTLRLRTGLRNKTLSPEEAAEATRILAVDKAYRAAVNNERKVAAGKLAQSGIGKIDTRTLNEVLRIRQVAAAAGVTPAYTAAQKVASDAIDKLFDDLYDYAAKASGGTGYIPPRRADYFPLMQSDKAIRWAERFPKQAEQLAKALNVDRTWFVGNFRARDLQPGDKFFGKVLTQADIDGGATVLNDIARKWGLKFDFFETDVLSAINKYVQKHAQFSALQKTIGSLPETLPTMAARRVGDDFVTPTPTPAGIPAAVGFSIADPATLMTLDPTPVLQLLDSGTLGSIIDDIDAIKTKLNARVVDKVEIKDLTDKLQARIDKIQTDYETGALTAPAAFVATDEVVKLAATVKDELDKVVLNIASVPASRWSEYAAIVKNGFEILNDDIVDPLTGDVIYKGTAPNIAVREELAELLRNATRMEDPQFAARVRQLALDYTRFAKAWLTARPGFHTRNAISNAFQLIAMGADPRNLVQANRILSRVNKGLKAGKTPREIAEELVDTGIVKLEPFTAPTTQSAFITRRQIIDAIEDSINYSGSTGFGQYGEIAREVGVGNRGLLQKGKPQKYNYVSRAIGKIPQGSRFAGEWIENYTRFGAMWDGISKGLSPTEAAARSDKFLIDYADLSNVDRVAKQIIPFWTFMSRNTPLQLELMWTNPKAMQAYSAFKRNYEEEGERYIPSYEKERGVFGLKTPIFGQDLIRPGLPFPGGGENVLRGLLLEPKKFLANVNPIFRAPFEAFITGEKFFTGGKVVPREWEDQPTNSKLKYFIREVFTPQSPVFAVLRAIPQVGRQKFMEDVFGLNVDEAEPLLQEVNSLISLFGLPVGTLRVDQQVREIESRIYELGDRIDAIRARQRIEREERRNP